MLALISPTMKLSWPKRSRSEGGSARSIWKARKASCEFTARSSSRIPVASKLRMCRSRCRGSRAASTTPRSTRHASL